MYKKYDTSSIFPNNGFDHISNNQNQTKAFSVDLKELGVLMDELFNLHVYEKGEQMKMVDEILKSKTKQPEDMNSKKIIMPTSTSKYRVVKKTANNKVIYVLEFANPTKLESTLVYNPVPGQHTFDTLEESQETIRVFKFNFQETTETVYEE